MTGFAVLLDAPSSLGALVVRTNAPDRLTTHKDMIMDQAGWGGVLKGASSLEDVEALSTNTSFSNYSKGVEATRLRFGCKMLQRIATLVASRPPTQSTEESIDIA